MCTPDVPEPKTIPQRQALKLPDGGATAPRIDDEIRRRRAMMATAYRALLGSSPGPATTTILGG